MVSIFDIYVIMYAHLEILYVSSKYFYMFFLSASLCVKKRNELRKEKVYKTFAQSNHQVSFSNISFLRIIFFRNIWFFCYWLWLLASTHNFNGLFVCDTLLVSISIFQKKMIETDRVCYQTDDSSRKTNNQIITC